MKKLFALTLVLCLVLANVGCRHNVNSANPQVVITATLMDALNTCKALEDGLHSANAVVEKLETAEPDYYAHVKPLLKKLSSANKAAAHAADSAIHGNNTDWRGPLLAVAASVKPSDLTSFGFKNPTSQALVEGGFATVVVILNQIPSKFGKVAQ